MKVDRARIDEAFEDVIAEHRAAEDKSSGRPIEGATGTVAPGTSQKAGLSGLTFLNLAMEFGPEIKDLVARIIAKIEADSGP